VQLPRHYLLLLFTSVLAAACTQQAIAQSYPLVPTPDHLVGLTQPSQDQIVEMLWISRANDILSLAMFGACAFAAGLPVFGARRRWIIQVGAFAAAVTAGAVLGYAMGLIGFYLQDHLPHTWDPLQAVAARWTLMLLPASLVAAVLVAVTHMRLRAIGNILVGGVIGGLLVAVLYAMLAGQLFHGENADAVLPRGFGSQMLLFTLSPLLIWGMIARQLGPQQVESQPETAVDVGTV
jgi:hypothetical protein